MDEFMLDPFCGTFYPSIDSKGRMSFPGKLRDLLGAEFYLCMSHDGKYIAAFSVDEFRRYCKELHERIPGPVGASILRGVLSGAEKQIPDKQGRIFISQNLRDRAHISGQVCVVGNYNHAEIWNPEAYEAAMDAVSQDVKDAALAGLVL